MNAASPAFNDAALADADTTTEHDIDDMVLQPQRGTIKKRFGVVVVNCTISRNICCGISIIGASASVLLRDLELSSNGADRRLLLLRRGAGVLQAVDREGQRRHARREVCAADVRTLDFHVAA